MPQPLAYLITWTCYGSWLHGDDRGSVDRSEASYGSSLVEQSGPRTRFEHSELKHDPTMLDADQRGVVRKAIEDHSTHRGWRLLALNVRTNHVHVVVVSDSKPETVMREFKAWATRRLRERELAAPAGRVWTRHGSTRYLFDDVSVEGAVRYVVEGQGVGLE